MRVQFGDRSDLHHDLLGAKGGKAGRLHVDGVTGGLELADAVVARVVGRGRLFLVCSDVLDDNFYVRQDRPAWIINRPGYRSVRCRLRTRQRRRCETHHQRKN